MGCLLCCQLLPPPPSFFQTTSPPFLALSLSHITRSIASARVIDALRPYATRPRALREQAPVVSRFHPAVERQHQHQHKSSLRDRRCLLPSPQKHLYIKRGACQLREPYFQPVARFSSASPCVRPPKRG
ncbi:hypothetical protein M440DRAFT_192163 [Trichoderma longibrachiatum ATCC 18648]|uniref:Uncharacterized protein n=1 Tax=Trichoderma longibrachiatum ATCC 18648 TaxID=983965 RepID=A0A2T4CFP2_TRILO|nr:hypothetical protein M440DRAFT_192163 [Trichoderma longibrachiatum ATCC 18648]